jgi:serine/threonine protein kinase
MIDAGNFQEIVCNSVHFYFLASYVKIKRNNDSHYCKLIGIQLGTGCFGRVVKAEAVGLKDSEEAVKTIAVKMVRSQANIAAMEALISELKILVYLGSHLNVVNLLGACTKQIHKGIKINNSTMLLFFICLFFLLLINLIFLLYRRTVCDR